MTELATLPPQPPKPTHCLLPPELRARLARATIVLAQREAEKIVKQRIAATGRSSRSSLGGRSSP